MARRSWLRDYGYRRVEGSPTLRQLESAFEILNYDFGYEEERRRAVESLNRFRKRWGSLAIDTMVTIARRFVPTENEHNAFGMQAVLKPETPEEVDVLFALTTLGIMRTPETPTLLLPFLRSPRAQERWLAAFGLAAMHDERALPALEQMLVEFVGPNQPWTHESLLIYIYQTLRHRLLGLLAEWADLRVVPLIRAGLIATVQAEEVEVPEPHGPEQVFIWGNQRYTGLEAWRWFYNEQLYWVDEEHEYVYALGRLGAFGALEGVPTRRGIYSWQDSWSVDSSGISRLKRRVPESRSGGFRANIWRVHACFGALDPQFRGQIETIYHFADAPELAEAVEQLLAENFDLDEDARRQAMDDYDQARWVYWTPIMYGWRVNQLPLHEDEDDDGLDDEEDNDEPEWDDNISLEAREAQDFGW